MGSGDGTVGGITKILDNGSDDARLNVVLVAEGFRDTEQSTFDSLCDEFVTTLQAEPWFPVLGGAINVHRLNVSSDESGADDPVTCADGSTGTGAAPATFFDASFCNGTPPVRRCLSVDESLVRDTLDVELPAWHVGAVLVNTTTRGGCASGNVFSTAISSDWKEVVLHELGHAAFGLADEYDTWSGCDDPEPDHEVAPGIEPGQPNVTVETDPDLLKWRHLVTPEIPIPTMSNPDCTQCNTAPNVLGDDLQIGLFEGAMYFHCGIYRPAYRCRMRSSSQPFCRVCIEAIHERLSDFMTPNPQMEVVTADGSLLLDFGDVAEGLTMFRSFEVRNVRTGWPGELTVNLSAITGDFSYAPGTETTFSLPAPVLEEFTSRPVFVSYTAPAGGAEALGGLDVTTPDDADTPLIHVDLRAQPVPPPTVDSVLVIDRSGSMDEPSGVPGQTKSDTAIEAASLYVSLLRDADQIGIVRYNDESTAGDVLLGMTPAAGSGRDDAIATLTPANLLPEGSTSIGSGIIRGSSVLDGGTSDNRALVVLTDGIQNTDPDIPDARAVVETKTPAQRVFAVGLGLNQLEDTLHEIASVTNGVAQITGDLVGWKEFLLQKLYVQILSDVSDEAFVRDPRMIVPPGERRFTDVLIGDVDVSADFIVVLRPTRVHPKYTKVFLEAPDGTLIAPSDAGPLPNVEFEQRAGHMFFRWLFPAFPDRPEAHVGRWRVWVENFWRPAGTVNVARQSSTSTDGYSALHCSVMCKARSDLRLGGRIEQVSYSPGSVMTIVLEPTLFGQPIELDRRPVVHVARPDGHTTPVTLQRVPNGSYRGEFTDTFLVGPYIAWTEVSATSPSGARVTRFRQMTGLIYREGRGTTTPPKDETNVPEDCCKEALALVRRLDEVLRRCCDPEPPR